MPKEAKTSTRFLLLDEIRGFAILCMVFFHAFYLLADQFRLPAAETLFYFFMPAEPYFAGAFLLISGICCRFSRSNFKRGMVLLAVAVLLTAATVGLTRFGINQIIKFGILHCIAVCILVFALIKPVLNKIPALLQIIIFIVLFIAAVNIGRGVIGIGALSFRLPDIITDSVFLYPIGLHSIYFTSADYFPVFPWVFLFLTGSAIGVYGQKGKFPRFFCTSHIKPLEYIGRRSLWIYLFHQPVIFLIAAAVMNIFKL